MKRDSETSRSAMAVVMGTTALFVVVVLVAGMHGGSHAAAGLPRAYELPALPSEVDSLTSLRDVSVRLDACGDGCPGIVYAWSPRMPLSRAGIPHVIEAAERLHAGLALVSHEQLEEYADGRRGADASIPLADAMLAAGALAHAPAVVIRYRGRVRGPAILGYKTTAAYEQAFGRRIGDASPDGGAVVANPGELSFAAAALGPGAARPAVAARFADYDVIGVPGAYFRWVPGRQAVAYESGQRIYLLDLTDGRSRAAPGYIDFVPTPDGRYFVTPAPGGGGLAFYDAGEVFEAVRQGRPGTAEPIFTDLLMRDQYPSIGVLAQDSSRTLYRVMTSWFEGVVYRDYDVRVDARSGVSSARPVGEPVQPCLGVALSTPIMSQDGLEVAGRDESTGTTKIFSILDGGTCEAVADLGVSTSKVAWHRTGRKIAFSIPRRRRDGGEGEQGIFVLDRDQRALVRLPGSETASRLAFPDFVGEESVVFLVPGETIQQRSRFRVVELAGSP